MPTKSSRILEEEILKKYNNDLIRINNALEKILLTQSNPSQNIKLAPNTPVIANVSNVSKVFNRGKANQVQALDNLSFELHDQEIVALVGASGSGKSTLLNLIAGLEKPTNGSVRVNGDDIATMSDKQLSEFRSHTIGFVFQFFYLQPFLTLEKNIQVPLMFAGVRDKNERQRRSDELIELVGLSDRKTHLPKELSGGQMQRVAIARALINKPKIVIADEPTGNLDSKNAESVMHLLDNIRTRYNSSVLVVTHDHKISQMADRVLTLEDGRIK